MSASALLQEMERLGIVLSVNGDHLRVDALKGALTPDLRQALAAHKPEVLKLLTAPAPDFLAETPCDICASRQRWVWLDGRHICRVCLILDLAPLTLMRQGCPTDTEDAHAG